MLVWKNSMPVDCDKVSAGDITLATAYLSHSLFQDHQMQPDHPECPQRLASIEDRLQAAGLMDILMYRDAPMATREQLERVHTARHIDELADLSPEEGLVAIDPDTSMCPATLEAAWRAAGASVLAVDMVMKRQVKNAFCAVRPAGHHAERDAAMGFCFFDNVAVGASHSLQEWGLERVAILDFDVHHGNGSEDIFRDDRQVMVCSVYQDPLYPYSGSAGVPGRLVNVPIPPGTAGPAWRAAISDAWLPAIEEFRPQFILVSAGFDGHVADPMAELLLTEADYIWLTDQILDLAERHADGRIVSCLEGGYDLQALARCVAAHIRLLAGV
jgi:acetoin utilization deacetylase AcuC-like enzyme